MSALTHTHLDAQEEHTKSHSCTESQLDSQRHRHVDRDKYMDSHPCRRTKVSTPKLVQVHLYRFTHVNTFHVNVQMDTETHKYTGQTQRHTGTQACISSTQTERYAPTWQSPARLHKHTVAQTRVCIVICMHANRSGHRYHRGIHKPRAAET